MQIRNVLFDTHILPSQSYEVPIISIGNLSYGGTGKTPLIEYMIRLLAGHQPLATLSRGYGRSSKGFILATRNSSDVEIGDEPMQFVRKFNGIRVAVDEKRRHGISTLLSQFPDLKAILLDDAYQHRYVKPGLSLLLTDYHKLFTEDYVLPSGTLREYRSNSDRADIIIVTKTPKIFSPITRRRIIDDMELKSNQRIYFSFIKYLDPVPYPGSLRKDFPVKITNILLFTGIANDYPLVEHLTRMCSEIIVMKFQDHHPFTAKDLDEVGKRFDNLATQKKVIITTEKDIMRMNRPELSTKLERLPLFYVPMEVDFHGDDKQKFDNEILNYVTKNQRNR